MQWGGGNAQGGEGRFGSSCDCGGTSHSNIVVLGCRARLLDFKRGRIRMLLDVDIWHWWEQRTRCGRRVAGCAVTVMQALQWRDTGAKVEESVGTAVGAR